MKFLRFYTRTFAGVICLAAPFVCRCESESVTGRVSDASNAPIAGATVTLQMLGRAVETFSAKTAKDGTYEFREVPDGNYSIEASMRGHITVRYSPVRVRFPFGYERDFRLPADEVYETDSPDKAHVAGELKITEKPLGGARVCLRRRAEQVCTSTNRLGQYSLLVQPGAWQVVVTGPKEKDPLWRQRLQLPKAGEYRDQIQIRTGPHPHPAGDEPANPGHSTKQPGGAARFRSK